ncbi:NnrS family protein [Ralstonia sp.]|uniref:NnrS family protein n=1 Tax=Ralstonia sp. TaxID=54061 RepID=UPI003979A4C8
MGLSPIARTGVAAIGGGLVWWLPLAQPLVLHLHLLLFGMGTAAVAGYLLTALPSWIGRAGVPAGLLWVLVALWLVGRSAVFLIGSIPWQLVVAPGVVFGGLLAGFLLNRVCSAGRSAVFTRTADTLRPHRNYGYCPLDFHNTHAENSILRSGSAIPCTSDCQVSPTRTDRAVVTVPVVTISPACRRA